MSQLSVMARPQFANAIRDRISSVTGIKEVYRVVAARSLAGFFGAMDEGFDVVGDDEAIIRLARRLKEDGFSVKVNV